MIMLCQQELVKGSQHMVFVVHCWLRQYWPSLTRVTVSYGKHTLGYNMSGRKPDRILFFLFKNYGLEI